MEKLTVKGGSLIATVSTDPDYPGIDIEYVADDDMGKVLSRPRVLVEYPEDMGLRALIWNNPASEDYNEEISFLNEDKTFGYLNIVEEIREAIKEGHLKADVNNANNVLIYRKAGDENHPEGWYSENILEVASELCHNENSYREFKKELTSIENQKKDKEPIIAYDIQWSADIENAYLLLEDMDIEQATTALNLPLEWYQNASKEERRSMATSQFHHNRASLEDFLGLPDSVEIPTALGDNEEDITNWLCDTYGCFLNNYKLSTDKCSQK